MDTGFTKIEWTGTPTLKGEMLPGYTFNPWLGCTKVSPGCDHCYAEARMDTWLGKVKWGAGNERVRTSAENWKWPERWNKRAAAEGVRRKVFCASLADVFDNEVPRGWRADLFDLIERTPALDWLLLTKRIGNAQNMLPHRWRDRDNVWLGATVVNQEEADRDIPKLLATPAAVRFLSIEPILGKVDLHRVDVAIDTGAAPWPVRTWFNAMSGAGWSAELHDGKELGAEIGWWHKAKLDWVIVGGESGAKARPTPVSEIRRVVRQCSGAGVAVFVKQLGANVRDRNDAGFDGDDASAWPSGTEVQDDPDGMVERHQGAPVRIRTKHPKGGHMEEWPEDLRVRQFPAGKTLR